MTPVMPGSVALDPTKRYYISILPGDAANPFCVWIRGRGLPEWKRKCDSWRHLRPRHGRRSDSCRLHAGAACHNLHWHLCACHGAGAALALPAGQILSDGL